MRLIFCVGAALAGVCLMGVSARTEGDKAPSEKRVPVEFSGGHELDGRDRGRPVVLIAAALGVPEEVFREAFSRVRPAPAGTRPTPERERENKRVLLEALAPYGVTNERLDEVSNYYRYQRGRGELWPTQPAQAYALVKGGKITRLVVTSGGSGYSSPPQARVVGAAMSPRVRLSWSQTFEQNGAVAGLVLAPGSAH